MIVPCDSPHRSAPPTILAENFSGILPGSIIIEDGKDCRSAGHHRVTGTEIEELLLAQRRQSVDALREQGARDRSASVCLLALILA
jgi:hypothetical protein